MAAWRIGSFVLGLAAITVAIVSPVSAQDREMLTAHMIQHLLLMTIAPPLLWLGAPPKLWWSRFANRRLQRVARFAGRPMFAWTLSAAVLVGWHIPAALRLGMQSGAWHAVEQFSFLAAGLLFWRPVMQPRPHWSILVYLFLATLPCDVLSAFLVFSDRVAYPMYLCMPANSGAKVLEDQQCAGALMWTCVTVVYLVAGTVLATRMLSPRNDARGLEVV